MIPKIETISIKNLHKNNFEWCHFFSFFAYNPLIWETHVTQQREKRPMGAATLAPKGAAGGSIKIACDASTAAPKRRQKGQQRLASRRQHQMES